jgi:hypothetical protein
VVKYSSSSVYTCVQGALAGERLGELGVADALLRCLAAGSRDLACQSLRALGRLGTMSKVERTRILEAPWEGALESAAVLHADQEVLEEVRDSDLLA